MNRIARGMLLPSTAPIVAACSGGHGEHGDSD